MSGIRGGCFADGSTQKLIHSQGQGRCVCVSRVSCAEQSLDGCTKQAQEGGVCVRYEEGGIAVYMVDKECQEAENEHIKL